MDALVRGEPSGKVSESLQTVVYRGYDRSVAGPETKASGFLSSLAAIRKMATPAAIETMTARLPSDIAELVRKPPLPVAWLPSELWFGLIYGAFDHLFEKDEQKMYEMGRLALLGDLRGVYKVFVKLLSPQFVIDRGTRLWDTYARNSGQLRAEPVGDKACDVFYENLPKELIRPQYWAYQRGAVAAAIEATGMKGIEVVVLAGGGANNGAILRCSWK